MVKMTKTFHARIETTLDALIVIEACRRGILTMVNRRLLSIERQSLLEPVTPPAPASSSTVTMSATLGQGTRRKSVNLIDHGAVFVFREDESGISRWTDGRIWSPSRISGNFLVYKELLHKFPNEKCKTPAQKAKARAGTAIRDPDVKEIVDREGLVVQGSAKGTFIERKNGLIKKTICVRGLDIPPPEKLHEWAGLTLTGDPKELNIRVTSTLHLVCYEHTTPLNRPSSYIELAKLPLSRMFLKQQKFRNPMLINPSEDDNQPWPFNEYVANNRIVEGRPQSKRATTRRAYAHGQAHRHPPSYSSNSAAQVPHDGPNCPVHSRPNPSSSVNYTSRSRGRQDDSWKLIQGRRSSDGKWRLISDPPPSRLNCRKVAAKGYGSHMQRRQDHGDDFSEDLIDRDCRNHDREDSKPPTDGILSPQSPASSINSAFSLSSSTSPLHSAEPFYDNLEDNGHRSSGFSVLTTQGDPVAEVHTDYLPEMNVYAGETPDDAGQLLLPGTFFFPPATQERAITTDSGLVPHMVLSSIAGNASVREVRGSTLFCRNHHRPYLSNPSASQSLEPPRMVRSAPSTPVPLPSHEVLDTSGPKTSVVPNLAPCGGIERRRRREISGGLLLTSYQTNSRPNIRDLGLSTPVYTQYGMNPLGGTSSLDSQPFLSQCDGLTTIPSGTMTSQHESMVDHSPRPTLPLMPGVPPSSKPVAFSSLMNALASAQWLQEPYHQNDYHPIILGPQSDAASAICHTSSMPFGELPPQQTVISAADSLSSSISRMQEELIVSQTNTNNANMAMHLPVAPLVHLQPHILHNEEHIAAPIPVADIAVNDDRTLSAPDPSCDHLTAITTAAAATANIVSEMFVHEPSIYTEVADPPTSLLSTTAAASHAVEVDGVVLTRGLGCDLYDTATGNGAGSSDNGHGAPYSANG
ncbi:hypothetical protein BGZ73_007778 [Actinomortierella ambigua]|nr:hypothetical protein BGZ73_007778 [Actinomortierella ambigua]